jgi:phage terminase large subunit-like protein
MISFAAALADALEGSWQTMARPSQLAPPGDWSTWLLLTSRGFGKTLAICQWAIERVTSGQASRLALVAATAADARDVLVEGPSGFCRARRKGPGRCMSRAAAA